MTPDTVVKKYLGIPYKHRGRDLSGLDCWGIVICVYADLGHQVWDPEIDYEQDWSKKGGNHLIENYWKEWDVVEKPARFDGVLFHNGSGVTNHAGIMLDGSRFLHASKAGVVVSRLSDKAFLKRFQGFYHLRARG